MEFLPKPNQKIDMKILFGPHTGTYSTYVEQVDETGIVVAAPMFGGLPLRLGPGQSIRLEYSQTGARVSFSTRVLLAERAGNGSLLRVAVPDRSDVERIQLRDFVRQEATLDLTFKVLSAPDAETKPRPDTVIRSRTRDISGSGAQILCPEAYPARTQLDLTVVVDGKPIQTLAEVIRPTLEVKDREWWVAVRFVGLQERDRDVIIRYIFNLQRDLRRRGLLGP